MVSSLCENGFMNCTDTIGIILGTASQETTGSVFLTLFILMLFLMAIALIFGIKLEYTAIIILPLLMGYMAYYSEFMAVGVVILIYLAIIFTKNFILK